jgi:hypothetical protein
VANVDARCVLVQWAVIILRDGTIAVRVGRIGRQRWCDVCLHGLLRGKRFG